MKSHLDKAKELIEEFYIELGLVEDHNLRYQLAKQCALLAARKLQNNQSQIEFHTPNNWWETPKIEISENYAYYEIVIMLIKKF